MSLATLKKKSKTIYGNSISSSTISTNGFYLNGNKRVIGSVNTTNLGKSVTRTPFKGTEPVGHGGGSRCRVSGRAARKCGNGNKYLKVVSNSGSSCTSQTLIKISTKNQKGLIDTKYKWMSSTYPNYWVKHINEPETTSSSSYIESLKNKAISNCGLNEIPCLNKESVVNIVSTSSGNKYAFNGLTTYISEYALSVGTYILKDIPQIHAMAILNNGKEGMITYLGDANNKLTKEVNGINYDFYYGDITINVISNFDKVSVYCYNHGYMGGENILRYTNNCEIEKENTSTTYIECTNKYHIKTKCQPVNKDVLAADTYDNYLSNLKHKCLELQHIPYAITKNATVY
tara:strand:- start:2637 stop:3671 length:1035 start_codon:yes stop_codon:yes gene_type:complete